jgi:voltage-gated potassium channel Kch
MLNEFVRGMIGLTRSTWGGEATVTVHHLHDVTEVEEDAVLVLGDVMEEAITEAVIGICQQVSLSGTCTKIAGIQRISVVIWFDLNWFRNVVSCIAIVWIISCIYVYVF